MGHWFALLHIPYVNSSQIHRQPLHTNIHVLACDVWGAHACGPESGGRLSPLAGTLVYSPTRVNGMKGKYGLVVPWTKCSLLKTGCGHLLLLAIVLLKAHHHFKELC